MVKFVILHHTGSKRGGWNVKWWLITTRDYVEDAKKAGIDLITPEEAVLFFGFKPTWKSLYSVQLGSFPTKQEAIKKARELGLEPITPQKLYRIIKKRGSL